MRTLVLPQPAPDDNTTDACRVTTARCRRAVSCLREPEGVVCSLIWCQVTPRLVPRATRTVNDEDADRPSKAAHVNHFATGA